MASTRSMWAVLGKNGRVHALAPRKGDARAFTREYAASTIEDIHYRIQEVRVTCEQDLKRMGNAPPVTLTIAWEA